MFQSNELFQTAIGLQDPWYITEIKFSVDEKRLDIFVDFKKGSRFVYKDNDGKVIGEFDVHDTRQKVWRHLNFFEHECYLHCRVPRVDIGKGKVRMCYPPFAGLSNGFTLLFEVLALQLCKSMTVAETSRLINESEHKLWEMIDRYIGAGRNIENYETVKFVGMDETSKAKGHDYITVFVDLKEKNVIFVTQGRDNKTVKRFVLDLEEHGGKAENIERVSCDLSPAFIKGVEENLTKAKITFDKFHVIQLINVAVDQVRREEVRMHSILKNARYAVLKNKENLTQVQKTKLDELKLSQINLKTLRAMHIRENFQYIYLARNEEDFETLLRKWYFWATHSRIPAIIKVAKTIKAHWEGIVSWYRTRINNGILEGINSIIQSAKSKARGYRSFKNFANIIYLLKGDLNFSLINSAYPPFFT
jgi:transposase